MDGHRARKGNASRRVLTPSTPSLTPVLTIDMTPVSVADVPALPDEAGPDGIDPATSTRIGSITYDREQGGYNLEWETRDDFERWLTHEQQALGIEIRRSKTRNSQARDICLTCETFRCTRNRIGGTKSYEKKTTRERKIASKRIEGGCPCYVQIKTYPHTKTVLGKYESNHSHETGKSNLKYIRFRVSTRELIEDWVRYGVTDQEIVSDPLFDRS